MGREALTRLAIVVTSVAIGCGSGARIDPELDGPAGVDDGAIVEPSDGGLLRDLGVAPADRGTTPFDARMNPSADLRFAPRDMATTSCASGCMTYAHCNTGTNRCECNDGFVEYLGVCLPFTDRALDQRSSEQVCAAWSIGHRANSTMAWVPGQTTCDPGRVTQPTIDDVVRRLLVFRWLVGLPAVANDANWSANEAQKCAIMMHANNAINHTPPSSWACYTSQGAAAAGASNLSWGNAAPDAIDRFIEDVGVGDLGHRRWILSNKLDPVGIGFAGDKMCLLVIWGMSGLGTREWTAWPNPGVTPLATMKGPGGEAVVWSINSNTWTFANASVAVVQESNGASRPVNRYLPAGNYGVRSLAWTPSGWTPAAGQAYRVTVSGITGAPGPVSYTVRPVTCP